MKSTEIFPHRDDIPEGFVPHDVIIPIPILERKYTVNAIGHIRSLWGRFGAREFPLPLSVSRQIGREGWYLVLTGADRKPWFQASVRSIVMLTFGGPKPKGHRVVPIDGDYDNHCFWNLEYRPMDLPPGLQVTNPQKRPAPKWVKPRWDRAKRTKMFSQADWDWVCMEYGRGRTLYEIWKEKFMDRNSQASFQTQFYSERKRRKGT
jgi:hypothetical protein